MPQLLHSMAVSQGWSQATAKRFDEIHDDAGDMRGNGNLRKAPSAKMPLNRMPGQASVMVSVFWDLTSLAHSLHALFGSARIGISEPDFPFISMCHELCAKIGTGKRYQN